MFKSGDMVVHPLHGAGTVCAVECRGEQGSKKDYYTLSFGGGMSVVMPADKCGEVGLRPVMCRKDAERIFKNLESVEIAPCETNWNRRYRENMDRIKSGDPMEVACVVKGLMRRDAGRGLSTGERRMLRFAKDILISEMTVSMDISGSEIEDKLTLAVG